MEEIKATVKDCIIKTDKGDFKVYKVTLDNDKVYDCFTLLEKGKEYEFTVKPNKFKPGEYPDNLFIKKEKKGWGVKKDWAFEKKKAALHSAAILGAVNNAKSSDVLKIADVFYEYLNS